MATRTVAEQNMTWHVAFDGDNATGDGSVERPWRTPQGAYTNLQRKWDMGGFVHHEVHVEGSTSQADIYPDAFAAEGLLVGQRQPLFFIGDRNNPLNCKMKPDGRAQDQNGYGGIGYAAAALRGAQVYFDGFLFDQSYGQNDISVAAGQGGPVLIFGANCQFANISPRFNMCTAYDTGKIQFEGGFKLYRRTTPPYDGDLPQCMFFAGVEGQIGFNNDAGNYFQPVLDLVGTPQFALCVLYAYRGTVDAQGLRYSGTFGPCPDKFAHSGGVIQYLRSDPMPGTTTFAGGPAHSGGIIYDSYP